MVGDDGTEPVELGRWAKVGVDGFVLEPPPLSIGRLVLIAVFIFGSWGVLGVGWMGQQEDPWAVYGIGGVFLLTLWVLLAGIKQAALRTTVAVRGANLRIERTWFGVMQRSWDVPVGTVTARPGKRRGRYDSVYIWLDLSTRAGAFRVGLGSYPSKRAEALLNGTLHILTLAKQSAMRITVDQAKEDPDARRALDALRGSHGER